MKKNAKYTIFNNKGVALITIMIAVAFISVIGTSLLYITYTNFQMKVLNLGSKQNFYETDGDLVKITAGIRNSIEEPEDMDDFFGGSSNFTKDSTNPKLFTAPKGAVKLTGSNGILDKAGLWDNVNNCVAAHNNGDEFTYSVVGDEDGNGVIKYVDGNITTYTIEGLKVKQVSKDKGYSNTVQTDLEIKVLERTGGSTTSGGLGNCSMLMDADISVDPSDVSFVSFLGNAYCAKYDSTAEMDSKTYTKPGQWNGSYAKPEVKVISYWPYQATRISNGTALYLTQSAKVNVEGDNFIVYGDILLAGNSCLNISHAKLKVFGDIYLMGNSTLICGQGSEIYLPEFNLPGRSEPCSIKSGIGVDASSDYLKKHMYYNGDIKPLKKTDFDTFTKLLNLNDANTKNDGIVNKIAKDLTFSTGEKVTLFDSRNNTDKFYSKYYDENCGIAIMHTGNVANLGQYQNFLVFVTDYGEYETSQFNFNATNVHSTFVSRAPIYLNTQNPIYYSKMGPEMYDYLKASNTSKYYDESFHKFKLHLDTKVKTGDIEDISLSDILDEETDTHINNLFNVGSSDSSETSYINSAVFNNYVKDAD